MGFSFNKVGEQLKKANEPVVTEKKEYELDKRVWKPQPGKNTIRIIQSIEYPENPFIEMEMHHLNGTKPALSNWGEKDPIIEKALELFKENSVLWGKYADKNGVWSDKVKQEEAKQLYFNAVNLVGGKKEDLKKGKVGVSYHCQMFDRNVDTDQLKFWTLTNSMLSQISSKGTELESNLIAYNALDAHVPMVDVVENGVTKKVPAPHIDITDAEKGFDVEVTYTPVKADWFTKKYPDYEGPFSDTNYAKYDITFAKASSVVTTDSVLGNKIMNEQLKVNDLFPKPTVEELTADLERFLKWKERESNKVNEKSTEEIVYNTPTTTVDEVKQKLNDTPESAINAFSELYEKKADTKTSFNKALFD